MLKFDEAKSHLKRDLNQMNNYEMIIIQCFKKDRSVTIKKLDDTFFITEQGYIKKEASFKQSNDCIKYVIKRINFQFPNSNNLWYQKRKIENINRE